MSESTEHRTVSRILKSMLQQWYGASALTEYNDQGYRQDVGFVLVTKRKKIKGHVEVIWGSEYDNNTKRLVVSQSNIKIAIMAPSILEKNKRDFEKLRMYVNRRPNEYLAQGINANKILKCDVDELEKVRKEIEIGLTTIKPMKPEKTFMDRFGFPLIIGILLIFGSALIRFILVYFNLPCQSYFIILTILGLGVITLLITRGFIRRSYGEVIECGECGAFISESLNECPKCGIKFETDLARCSECEAWIPSTSESCPNCGTSFTIDDLEKKILEDDN